MVPAPASLEVPPSSTGVGTQPTGRHARQARGMWRRVAIPGMIAALVLGLSQVVASGPASAGGYDAVYRGDATGRTDVTSSLRRFLERHDGDRVALAKNGRYRVTSLGVRARNLTVDFRGSRLVSSKAGVHGILRLATARNVVLNDPYVIGSGYRFDWDLQNEHGIHIDGGSNIRLNHPVVRRVHGDGIYIGYQRGKNSPAKRVRIYRPNIRYASRNGIAPVAGQVTIRGGSIRHVGIIGIDFEVNDDAGARSIQGVVDDVDIRDHGEFPGYSTDYAIAAAGYSRATKHSIRIENVTGDKLTMLIRDTARVVIRKNVSDRPVRISTQGSSAVTFSGNRRISRS